MQVRHKDWLNDIPDKIFSKIGKLADDTTLYNKLLEKMNKHI